MFSIEIQGFGKLDIKHLVLDYNGTLAHDGEPIPGVPDLLKKLSSTLNIHILTADTHGACRKYLTGLPVNIEILTQRPEELAKRRYVEQLCPDHVAAIGNGRNDRLMLKSCALGIAVLGTEGTAASTMTSADIVIPGILSALELFLFPKRLLATLRT